MDDVRPANTDQSSRRIVADTVNLPSKSSTPDQVKRWRDENRQLIEAWNKWDDENPLFTDQFRPS